MECTNLPAALSESELSILSMQLRKSKVSFILVSDNNMDALQEMVCEQDSAKASFPGPIPVLYHGNNAATAAKIGAAAIVRSADDDDDVEMTGECEIIWKVENMQQARSVIEKTGGTADAFLVNLPCGDDNTSLASDIMATLPQGALCIASIGPMQTDAAEIGQGKELKKLGYASILVRSAVVGDAEDLPYAQYLVEGLTSKASSQFKFTGLTGSTNGHFGGVQANGSAKWRRNASSSDQ